MNPMKKNINPAEVLEFLENNTVSATLRKFGIGITTVDQVRAGTWTPPGQETQREKCIRLKKSGMTPKEIAAVTGLHLKTVYTYTEKRGSKRRLRPERFKNCGIEKIKSGPCKLCGKEKGANRYWCSVCHTRVTDEAGDCPESDNFYNPGPQRALWMTIK